MMGGVYAYCVLPGDAEQPPEELAGLGGAPVRGHTLDGLTVWLSDAAARPDLDLEAVERHHQVVQAALPRTVVPLRFGSWAPDLSSLGDRIRGTRADLDAALRWVAGRLEFGVRIREARPSLEAPSGQPVGAVPGSGREYLHALARVRAEGSRRRREQDDLATGVRAFLGSAVLDQRVTYLEAPETVALAHLVKREDERYYRALLEEFAGRAKADHILHVTGPWPPYTFAAP